MWQSNRRSCQSANADVTKDIGKKFEISTANYIKNFIEYVVKTYYFYIFVCLVHKIIFKSDGCWFDFHSNDFFSLSCYRMKRDVEFRNTSNIWNWKVRYISTSLPLLYYLYIAILLYLFCWLNNSIVLALSCCSINEGREFESDSSETFILTKILLI